VSEASARPGSVLARRPLHFFLVADVSGSMAADGKIQALNTALREALPHVVEVAQQNPHVEVLVRAIAFGTGARWHIGDPVRADAVEWQDLAAGGFTDLGAAIDLLAEALSSPALEQRGMPPAVLFISDGMPTDDYESALARLLALPWGRMAIRTAIAIGRDADRDMLRKLVSDDALELLSANNPEQLVRIVRWASVHLSKAASTLTPAHPSVPRAMDPDDVSEVVW
jgi:uncharacterized protein YegL